MAKPKGVHTAVEKPRYNKLSKLPPRFAKQREQLRSSKTNGSMGSDPSQESSMFMPKIENWDNELANNIPPLMSQVIDTSKLKDNLDLSNSKFTITV